MIKDNQNFNESIKPNSDFLTELKEKLPEFFNGESEFDLPKFKSLLKENNIYDELTSGNQINFIGKEYARKQVGERPTTVVVPDIEHNETSENENSENIFFTGDNLEVLRHMQNYYQNSIDMVYIDPPYNTGNDDFIYPDNFEYNDEKLQSMFGLNDEELKRLKTIQGKATHSAWLTFMYPRLYLAKKLLKPEGVIFVSIDDNEQANLKILMDEIFGEGNFVSTFIRKSGISPRLDSKYISIENDYILLYCKNITTLDLNQEKPPEDDSYKSKDSHYNRRGKYKLNKLDRGSINYSKSLDYPIKAPDKTLIYPGGTEEANGWCWRWSKEKFDWGLKNDFIEIKKGKKGWSVYFKQYEFVDNKDNPLVRTIPYKNLLIDKFFNEYGNREIKDLFGESGLFNYPKPVELISHLIKIIKSENSIILDFFAGSSTTAHAVMQLNAEDGGNRKFIMVNSPEPTYALNNNGEKVPTKAFKAGFMTIDEFSRERIRLASQKIQNQPKLTLANDFDGGFKHFRVVEPNEPVLDLIDDFKSVKESLFDNMINPFSSDSLGVGGGASGVDTILTTWLLADGYSLDAKIEKKDFVSYSADFVEDTRLYLIKGDGWGAEQTRELLNQIGKNQFSLQTIVYYKYHFDMETVNELQLGLSQLDKNIKLLGRF